ncbi:DNA modification methylase [Leucobacter sp. CSA1]|uniref:DNA modification methylase n=1 Tax=Leucobacter chromiisoli TaxID=2796471 RepID=A0A934UVX6_9MICO|nr:DNA modification methylase [Leucobacter chromiisoli]MBK0419961.1 DNA modification methylase [Leucobacter chromiisoli]
MKIRIASSIALAAALALGASGCSLIAPIATLDPYAPSDGRDIDVDGLEVRNILLIADETGENFNVVFTGLNAGESAEDLMISFVGEGSQQAAAEFRVEPGLSQFGDPDDGDNPPVLVSIPNLKPGATVTAYLSTPGSAEVEYEIPVLDGELAEYERFVLPEYVEADQGEDADGEGSTEAGGDAEQGADSESAGSESAE